MVRSPRPILVPLVLLVLLTAAACGRDRPRADRAAAPETPPDRSTPEAVLVSAHRAVAAGDLDALAPWFTARGVESLRRDLEAWRVVLADPATGPRAVARLPAPEGPDGAAAMRKALAGEDPRALFRLYVRTDPRPAVPPLAPAARPPDATVADLTVPAADGGTRWVRLVRTADRWRVEQWNL